MSTSLTAATSLSAETPPPALPVGSRSVGSQPAVSVAVATFADALLAKSRRTAANYQSALRRFAEFLEDVGRFVTEVTTKRRAAALLHVPHARRTARG